MPWQCTFDGCLRTFDDITSRKKHASVHSGDKPHRCHYCLMAFSDLEIMMSHVNKYHEGATSPTTCAAAAATTDGSRRDEFWCPNCSSIFTSISDVDTHIHQFHNHNASELVHNDVVTTPECDSASQSASDSALALSLHCTYEGCNRTFNWPHHLQYHINTHEGNRSFACFVVGCSQSFYTAQQRRVHIRTHTGERNFVCSLPGCYKRFTTAQNAENHVRTHTGEKPYHCTHVGCDKSFAESSSLKKHSMTHTGDKPYRCDVCNRTFTQSSSLCTHRKRRHNEKASTSGTTSVADHTSKSSNYNSKWQKQSEPESTADVFSTSPSCYSRDEPITSNVIVVAEPYNQLELMHGLQQETETATASVTLQDTDDNDLGKQ